MSIQQKIIMQATTRAPTPENTADTRFNKEIEVVVPCVMRQQYLDAMKFCGFQESEEIEVVVPCVKRQQHLDAMKICGV